MILSVSTIPTTCGVPGTDSGCIHAVAVDPWPDAEVGMKDGTDGTDKAIWLGQGSHPPTDLGLQNIGKYRKI